MRVPGRIQPKPNPDKEEVPVKKPRKAGSKSPLFQLSLLSAFITIALYYACTIRPEKFWIAGFSGFLIPPAILIQLFLLAYWLWKKPLLALIPGLALFLGMRFIQASWGWHFLITEKCSEFKVLSINAKAFGSMEKPGNRDESKTREMVEKIISSEADILCVQEMHDFPGRKPYNIVRTLKKAGYKHSFYSIADKSWG
jgi:hypothetical protein